MIVYLSGILRGIAQNNAVILVNGIGYQVEMTETELAGLPQVGANIDVHTVHVVRDDDVSLYGFLNEASCTGFKELIKISGVGPKLALNILSGISLTDLLQAVAAQDAKALNGIKGVGQKMAQRLLIELKHLAKKSEHLLVGATGKGSLKQDALSVLLKLGYTQKQALSALDNVDPEESAEAMIRHALQALST